MTCQHLSVISDQDFRMPDYSSLVLNDECSQCFQTPESTDGLYICTKCWNGGCQTHATNHSRITSHSVALHLIKRALPSTAHPKDFRPKKVTKLAIGGENGFPLPEAVQYEISTQLTCMQCPNTPEISSDQFKPFIEAIVDHKSLSDQTTVQGWEEERVPCVHTQNLQQLNVPALSQKSFAHCNTCDLRDNLWLCIICGSLGCSRSVYGGGGNNHGVEHNNATGHNVVCKLGTITPEGTADIYCYACDEMRVDENLLGHLQHFGIATNEMQKTGKTMAEMELEQNLNHEWSKIIENDEAMKLLYGPGYTGLKNLGNSCYLASTVQVLFSLPSFRQRYYTLGKDHLKSCRSWRPWDCYQCQMAKLASGLLSGECSKCPSGAVDESVEQPGISPSMFKRLISSSHSEFRTFRQQDAMQFFQYLLHEIRKQERSDSNLDPSSVFSFMLEQRLECSTCRRVRYTSVNTSDISLDIPAEQADCFPFSKCLEMFKDAKTAEFKCPHCHTTTSAQISYRFLTFPDVLIIHMQRFNYNDWVPKKIQTKITVPMSDISLESLRGHGQLPNEISLPDIESHAFASSDELLQQLLMMGFSTNACVRALKAVNNSDVSSAADWMFAHLDDPDINEPISEASSSSNQAFDTEGLAMLSSMGFDEERCKKALSETNGDVQRAADWLMSHAEESEIMPGSQGPAVYKLAGMITHLGPSIHFGHYVAHVYNAEDRRWVYFNDNKVSDSIKPPTEMAYMYCFQRQV